MAALNSGDVSSGSSSLTTARRSAACAVLVLMSGCGVAPSVNILGSFFPAWLISIVAGIVLTVLTRQAFLIARIAPYLRPAAVAYGCLILLWTLATWLVVFAS
jgi:YtcA family